MTMDFSEDCNECELFPCVCNQEAAFTKLAILLPKEKESKNDASKVLCW